MIAGIGGVVLLISLFLDWISGVTVSSAAAGVSFSVGGGSAFDVFSAMDIIMLIIAVLAIGWAGAAATGQTVPPQSGLIIGLLGVVVAGWCLGWDLENSNAGIGSWLGLGASVAIAWGGLAAMLRPATSTPAPAEPTATPAA
jgi:hypothetical protein